MGKVVGIATRDKKGEPMIVCASVGVTFKSGVGGDCNSLVRNNRQITLMAIESWDAVCKDLDRKLHWATRKANILVEGIDLKNTTNEYLQIGNIYLQITGELKPCYKMDEQFNGLQNALASDWRGGVTCKLINEGEIHENDKVIFVEKV